MKWFVIVLLSLLSNTYGHKLSKRQAETATSEMSTTGKSVAADNSGSTVSNAALGASVTTASVAAAGASEPTASVAAAGASEPTASVAAAGASEPTASVAAAGASEPTASVAAAGASETTASIAAAGASVTTASSAATGGSTSTSGTTSTGGSTTTSGTTSTGSTSTAGTTSTGGNTTTSATTSTGSTSTAGTTSTGGTKSTVKGLSAVGNMSAENSAVTDSSDDNDDKSVSTSNIADNIASLGDGGTAGSTVVDNTSPTDSSDATDITPTSGSGSTDVTSTEDNTPAVTTKKPSRLNPKGTSLSIKNGSRLIASVRVYPSEIHVCSAIFVSQNALLTTARCVFRLKVNQTYVHALSRYVIKGGETYAVKEFFVHPAYEAFPLQNDVAVLSINGSVTKDFIFSLPLPGMNQPGLGSIVFGWRFTPDMKQYFMEQCSSTIISNAKCTIILNEFIDKRYICAGGKNFEMGSLDQGSPLAVRYNNSMFVLGLYDKNGGNHVCSAQPFFSIFDQIGWITDKIKDIAPKSISTDLRRKKKNKKKKKKSTKH